MTVREGFGRILSSVAAHAPQARLRGVLVTPMVRPVAECAIGFARDPVFGPVAMVGLGGIFVEVLRDVALAPCPFGTTEAEAMIRSLRGFPLLDGARGRPKADVVALAEALARLSVLRRRRPGLASRAIDVNPLAVLAEGRGVLALDAALDFGRQNEPPPP
ncbi:MAG: acetate--CoA ligase family protein [Acetobacteraceae bacterium]|nr:acetate--CoA ligase family protein [Acetobacteraceae bacterium]